MVLPTFLVIGAGRSGTTTLHHHLAAHPDVHLPPVKAPSHFYCVDRQAPTDPVRRRITREYFVPDARRYEALFQGAGEAAAVGEVSPAYLAATFVAERISSRLPDVRLVAIFRDPIERVRARWTARVRDGLERRSFAQLVADELPAAGPIDDAAGTDLAAGFVSHVVRTYIDRFPTEHLRWYLHDDLRDDADGVVRDLYDFVGVDPGVPIDAGRRDNPSGGLIGSGPLRAVWTATARARVLVRPVVPRPVRDAAFRMVTRSLRPPDPIDPATRLRLCELYRDEVDTLGRLIGRDLSAWLHEG